jgi:hypothetical protein
VIFGTGIVLRFSRSVTTRATARTLAVPAKHCFAFDDQKRSVPTDTCNRGVEERKDRPIGIGEPWSADLTLKNQGLVPEGKDLSVT